ncbi:hypothetical protein C2G38_2070314 [Gigaspora rosea]|uniref:Uncharacterized protein n=1 Tax=Gigaspora rosea TaxID=44941 RepID=A0A397VQT8_9GLOM|nr:hypothetical protein C2G38_2070314 [Gigaspora rosea]
MRICIFVTILFCLFIALFRNNAHTRTRKNNIDGNFVYARTRTYQRFLLKNKYRKASRIIFWRCIILISQQIVQYNNMGVAGSIFLIIFMYLQKF